jgi:hypothetical protein
MDILKGGNIGESERDRQTDKHKVIARKREREVHRQTNINGL